MGDITVCPRISAIERAALATHVQSPTGLRSGPEQARRC